LVAPTVTFRPAITTVTPLPTATITPSPEPRSPFDALPPTATVAIPQFLPPEQVDIVDAVLTDAQQLTNMDWRLLGLKQVIWNDLPLTCNDVDQNTLTVPQGVLEQGINGYRIMIGDLDNTQVRVYHATDNEWLFCPDANVLDVGGDALSFNLFSQELIQLALNDLAQQLGVRVGSIRVADAFAITWVDSSLGCPAEGQNYVVQLTDGYRIVLASDDVLYAYHSDFSRVQPCPLGREELPPPFDPTATPTITNTPLPTAIP